MTGLINRFALRASPLLLAGCSLLNPSQPAAPTPPYVAPPLAQTFLSVSDVPATTYRIRNAYTQGFMNFSMGRTARFINSDGSTSSLACDAMSEKAGQEIVTMVTTRDMRVYARAKSQLNQYNEAQSAIGCKLAIA